MFRSDHFTNPQPPDYDALDLIVSLTYAASHSERIHFGALVTPVSFREPVMLTRQIAALDDLSGGRAILGMGAGWQEREHKMFGYTLGDVKTRMARLEEALEVSTRLLRSDGPANYEGQFYQLHDAAIRPRREGTKLLIGGNGPKRTLPFVARYADIWNGVGLKPEAFRERSALLDGLLREQGRDPGAVRRTLMVGLLFARDEAELERKLRDDAPDEAKKLPYEELVARQRNQDWFTVFGTPAMIKEQIAPFEAAGVEEIMLQWHDFDDLEGLQILAQGVL